jgi:hypothetical protein
MKGKPGPIEDLRAIHRVLPGAAHHSEAVVSIGIERVERERKPPRSSIRETARQILRDTYAVGADNHPQSAFRRAPDDLEDIAPQQRLAAR